MIEITVEITANHLGWFEFRVCSLDWRGGSDADQACLDEMLLSNGTNSRFPVPVGGLGAVTRRVYLPPGLTCNHCVLQVS